VDPRIERIAHNEALYREMNEGLAAWEERRDGDARTRHEFFCECGDSLCQQRVLLRRLDYEAIRANPMHFAVLPGHVFPDAEHVVDTGDGYLVIEKPELVRPILEATDPRRVRPCAGCGG
jgi:hypothetical protein